jgi:hypothetical protein
MVQMQPREIVGEILSRKNTSQKCSGGVAQGVGPKFKLQSSKKKKKVVIIACMCENQFTLKRK